MGQGKVEVARKLSDRTFAGGGQPVSRNSIGTAGRSYRPSPNALYRVLILLVFLEIPLKAYADPGSGLLLWQIAGAFVMGVLFQVRQFFGRLRKKK
jgi:hypothetical protein